MLLWPSISLALSGAWCILPHRIGSDQINKALLLGLASPNSMRYTGFMALNLKQERLLRLPACDWPKGLKVSPSDLAERSLGFTYLSWMIKMEKLPDLAALRGCLHQMPENALTKEVLMLESGCGGRAYNFSAEEGTPEEIPRDHWTTEVLCHMTGEDRSVLSALRDRGKMDILLGLDFDVSAREHFGEWWEKNESYKRLHGAALHDCMELELF